MVATVAEAASLVASKNPMVVIVEDDDVYREYLAVLLRSTHCQVKQASCSRELFEILATEDVDCILLDYNLGEENGLAIHAQIKDAIRDAPPIVMLTVEQNERTIIKAFRGGVSDYVLKTGLKEDELFKSINEAIDRRARARAQDAEMLRLKRSSEFDDATGLYSRATIDERLRTVAAGGSGVRCAIILATVDNLDTIAAKFGQVIADRALRAFVTRFKKSLGPYDIGGRYDGTRFISVTDVDVRFKTVDLTCRKLASELSFDANFDAVAFKIIACIGAAIYPLNGRSIGSVLGAAEQALKTARAQGTAFAIAEAQHDGEHPPADAYAAPEPVPAAPAAAASIDPPEPARGRDRRAAARNRVFKRGQILLPDMLSTVECTIRDISTTGARLRVEGLFMAPDRFELMIPGTGEKRLVTRRWQRGNEFGVKFVP
jgi:diguanylate cyclase (GGDEF)-like protein